VRARRWLAACLVLAASAGGTAPARAEGSTVLSYSVREARAYAYRVSLSKEVIEAAQTLQPCDPETDPYQCDDAAYEHAPNCPKALTLGPDKAAPEPEPAPGIEPIVGGAGDQTGPADAPPLASPITLNQQLSLGSLSHLGAVVEAGGLATDSYVDLSGRQEPAMHTESDAFSANRAGYEERCAPDGADESEYAHFLSRSFRTPETYHLAECRKRECTFGGAAIGAETERAMTMVHLAERGGRLVGRVHASLHDAVWGGGALTADLLDTTVVFSSDGTPGGLSYSVGTTALGVTFTGVPVTLPPGRPLALPGLQIGVATPYVHTAEDGRVLDVVAPGLYIATDNQTVLFGGAEVHATMGRQPPPPDLGGGDDNGGNDNGSIDTGGSGSVGGGPSPSPTPVASPTPATTPAPSEPELAVTRIRTGGWVAPMLVGAGLLAALLLLVRWIGRYPWGRRLYRAQPLRAIDWLYRAFVKT
jgi:hypothetical protein